MNKAMKLCFTICFLLITTFVITSCGDGENSCEITKLNLPNEDYIVTDLNYSSEMGLQVMGYTKHGPTQITASVLSNVDAGEVKVQFQEKYDCTEDKEIGATVYWSDKEGFFIPYTSKPGDYTFESTYYYVNSNGSKTKLNEKEFNGISEVKFITNNKLFWINYIDNTLMEWDRMEESGPSIFKLDGVKDVNRIAYYDNYLYILGFKGDSTIVNTSTNQEEQPTENLKNLAKDLFNRTNPSDDFTFAVHMDEKKTETVFFADKSGIWKYKDGNKELLIDGVDAEFGEEPYYNDTVVKDGKSIFVKFFKVEMGEGISELIRYDFE